MSSFIVVTLVLVSLGKMKPTIRLILETWPSYKNSRARVEKTPI